MRGQITAEQAREVLTYDPETGFFVWNTGNTAGCFVSTGYWRIKIFRVEYLAHRLAWLISTGEWPDGEIDHINQNRSDNRLVNLRVVTRSENLRNAKLRETNTSRVTGVHMDKKDSLWWARIQVNKSRVSLGRYKNWFDAVCARKSAENIHGYHPNHGGIAQTGEFSSHHEEVKV